MNKEWDLTPFYKGMDDEKLEADFAALSNLVKESNAFAAALTPDDRPGTIHRGIALQEQIAALAFPMFEYAMLRSSVNTKDTEALAFQQKLMKRMADTSAADAAFHAYIGKTENLDEIIDADPFLQDYRFLLEVTKADAKYVLDEKVEEALAKLNLSGGAAWENLQSYLTSTVTADYRGEKLTLSSVRNLAYDPDPQVRKDAYDAEVACYEKIQDGVCFALNNLKQQVNTVCQMRGAGSALDVTLRQSKMSRKTLDALIQAVEEYLPEFWRYLRAKAKLLGYEGGLKWWDLFAPVGKNTATYTVEEAKQYLLDHFRPFAEDMAQMMEDAFDQAWIDFYPREGKVGGAFCANAASIKQSRILTNFDGAFGDIVTLAHELGHAYHGMMIENHRPLNQDYPMPLAESASNFNETVVMNAAISEATDPEVKLGLLESRLQDITQIMCDILSRYWFETAMFEKAENGFAFPDELCEMMKTAQRRGYGDGLDLDTLNPYMWVCKSHYYSAAMSFYNFPYAFGGLFSMGLYARYLREGEAFLPKYRALLHATPVKRVEDVAKMADIDLEDVDFWRSSLEIVKAQIDEFVRLAGKKQ